jgi:hypothetical protein
MSSLVFLRIEKLRYQEQQQQQQPGTTAAVLTSCSCSILQS